jgi:hypothetical protein
VQTTFIFIDLSIPNFILGEFEGFEKPVGQFRPNVQYGKKLQITLVTDNGNRQGVDHFVKMICWTSIDSRGKHILRHFNFDVD